jgi:hypothetical protein
LLFLKKDMAFQFHVSIKDSSPVIWRRLIVPAEYTFYQLHLSLQGAFGWENCHLFQFSKKGWMDKESIGIPEFAEEMVVHEAKDILLSTVFKKKKDKQIYTYDFGDNWDHIVLLEEIFDKEPYWTVCIDGKNECPPEDVGGIGGYEEMVKCFSSGTEKEKKSYREWLGLNPKENWNSANFSIREINKRLSWIFAE